MMFTNMMHLASTEDFPSEDEMTVQSGEMETEFWEQTLRKFRKGDWIDVEHVFTAELMEKLDILFVKTFMSSSKVDLGFASTGPAFTKKLSETYCNAFCEMIYRHNFPGTLIRNMKRRREIMINRIKFSYNYGSDFLVPTPVMTVNSVRAYYSILRRIPSTLMEVSRLDSEFLIQLRIPDVSGMRSGLASCIM